MAHRITTTLLGLVIASVSYAQSDVPPFVARLIERFESASPASSPGAVWQYRYNGATVYYVPGFACCDIMSILYDANGKLICRPDGGIAGSGDGKCPDFLAKRKDGWRLWADSRMAQ
jgi:hypothetical protein